MPFVVVAVVLARRVPQRADTRPRPRVDWAGAALCALGLAGPVLALIEQPERGWGDPLVWGGLLGGAILLAAFLALESRSPHPMLQSPVVCVDLLSRRTGSLAGSFSLASAAGCCAAS